MRQWIKHHWFRWWLVAWTAPSHYLKQCWIIVNWTLRSKLQWNFSRNSNIFIEENPFQNVVWKMVAILSRPQCVNTSRLRQNWRNFADDIIKLIFLTENIWISLRISLKFVPEVRINNNPALVQIMAWCRPDNPWSELMIIEFTDVYSRTPL